MKQLKEDLRSYGYDISERMVKYYIEIGILPQPEHPYPNQSIYSDIHLIRLRKILSYKESGIPFSQIKESIEKDNEYIMGYAQSKNVSFDEAVMSYEIYAREESAFLDSMKSDFKSMSRESLIKEANCDRMIYDLAVNTGALYEKSAYDINDLRILVSIRNLFKLVNENGKIDIIDRISEVSKLNNLASQYVHLFENSPENKWLYDSMFKNITESKLEQACKRNID